MCAEPFQAAIRIKLRITTPHTKTQSHDLFSGEVVALAF